MTQYILLIHDNERTKSTPEQWDRFFVLARQSGLFQGGSAMGNREVLGDASSVPSSQHIVGYMRFDADDKQPLLDLLQHHPAILCGGTVELCELPRT